jgi:hypothetical protein
MLLYKTYKHPENFKEFGTQRMYQDELAGHTNVFSAEGKAHAKYPQDYQFFSNNVQEKNDKKIR